MVVWYTDHLSIVIAKLETTGVTVTDACSEFCRDLLPNAQVADWTIYMLCKQRRVNAVDEGKY